jgi:quercetin dioxygenase-like cupin family protein
MALEHAGRGEKVHVGPLGPALVGAKTSALVKTDRFELIRLVLEAGSTIPVHAVPGYISLHCLEGGVILEAGEPIRLRPNDWVYLARQERHALRALESSSVLLTIYFD